MLKIYNSLTQKKEIFTPIQSGKVAMYVCGVTVYDYCHLGHARTYMAFDSIIRYLRFRGLDVIYVRNITDIDDKIIQRAESRKEDFHAVVSEFTSAMETDFAALNLLPPTHAPRATEYIPQMILLIQKLIENNHAYIGTNGDVYYAVRQFKNYGCLAHRDIDKLESGARVEVSTVKRDPLDFVLWKLAKPGEPLWESPWGAGRPGWHTECSAMSQDLLGDTFDIHGGGKDLIFPHHENEIAQSEAISHQKLANIWMHAGFLQIEKEKMSKSLGNFLTIRDLLADHKPEVIRYFLITSHYRSPIHYSSHALVLAHSALERFYIALRDLPKTPALQNSEFEKKFIAAMDDDFNTPIAISVLFELTHEIQRLRDHDKALAAQHAALLIHLAGALGILQDNPEDFLQAGKNEFDTAKIENLIAARNNARAAKNFAEADTIRKQLLDMFIVLEDGAEGTTWKVVK